MKLLETEAEELLFWIVWEKDSQRERREERTRNDKTWTYMRSPNQCSLWAQRTSEKMNLGTGKQRGGGMDGGRERDRTIKIKSIKSDGTNRTPTQKTSLGHFLRRSATEGAERLNKVLCRRTENFRWSLLFTRQLCCVMLLTSWCIIKWPVL